MSVINLQFLGRFGNCMCQYAYARAYAEKHGCRLHTDRWIGQRIFGLTEPPIERDLPQRTEQTVGPGEVDITFRTYAQDQRCLIYSRADAKRWFKVRDHMVQLLAGMGLTDEIAAHRRVGDYPGYGYPVVSRRSYTQAARKFGFDPERVHFITEESPAKHAYFQREMAFMPDFYRLVSAPVLFRGNSTFSWWAGVLSEGRVFAPVIAGLEGGKEHDCEFVEGNWPRFCNLDFVTDLHLT